jgi:hypothetical protein
MIPSHALTQDGWSGPSNDRYGAARCLTAAGRVSQTDKYPKRDAAIFRSLSESEYSSALGYANKVTSTVTAYIHLTPVRTDEPATY